MNMRKKKSRNVFTYNGYTINHQDYNSKVSGILNSKIIVSILIILILIFFLIGIIWNLK